MASSIHSLCKAAEKQAETAFRHGEPVGTRLLVKLPKKQSMVVPNEVASIGMIASRIMLIKSPVVLA